MFEYWAEWPPTHEILKAVHGIKTTKTARVEDIRTKKAPAGHLSIEELRKIVAARPIGALVN